jgi:hypothetical protein
MAATAGPLPTADRLQDSFHVDEETRDRHWAQLNNNQLNDIPVKYMKSYRRVFNGHIYKAEGTLEVDEMTSNHEGHRDL